jgi:uncharacterized flavoprotein (TIGR03862 family)
VWADILRDKGVEVAAFQPANMGLRVDWSPHMARFFGQPVKACALKAGASRSRGEFVISAKGMEGGGIYALGRETRASATLSIDLLPDHSVDDIVRRLAKAPAKASLPNRLRKALRLDAVRIALLQEFARPLPGDPALLAAAIKAVPVTHQGPRPIDEAISTAGGVTRAAMDDGLMLRALPGVFVAGEMLDWEAPTGGYLLTACLASGRWAGLSAAKWLAGGLAAGFDKNGDRKS